MLELKKLCESLAKSFDMLREAVDEAIEDMKENNVDNHSKNVKLFPFSIKRTH